MSPNNARALAATVILTATYFSCQTIAVPYAPSFHLMTQGLKPVFGAFLLVEVLSFILPPLTSFRRQGVRGRRKLNVAVLLLALLFAVLQSYVTGHFLLNNPDVDGELPNLVPWLSAESQLVAIVMLSLVGGAILATILADGITRLGIANGFSLLLLGEVLWLQVADAMGLFTIQGEQIASQEFDLTRLILLIGTIAIAVWLLARRRAVPAETGEGLAFELPIPPLPQGVVALNYAYLASLFVTFWLGQPWFVGPWPHFLLILLLVAPMSWAFYIWFSSPERIDKALLGRLALKEPARITLSRQAVAATGALIGTTLAMATIDSMSRAPAFRSSPIEWMVITASLVAVAALLLDIYSLWSFRQRVGSSLRLLELDNVHVATYLQSVLEQKGIDCCLQGYQHRRLLFHLGAAIKIGVYVPVSQVENACDVMRIEQFQTI